jgi:hypothetical protein
MKKIFFLSILIILSIPVHAAEKIELRCTYDHENKTRNTEIDLDNKTIFFNEYITYKITEKTDSYITGVNLKVHSPGGRLLVINWINGEFVESIVTEMSLVPANVLPLDGVIYKGNCTRSLLDRKPESYLSP